MPYVERVTKAGNTIEIERYFTSRYKKKGISRGDKVKPTKEEQEKVNTRQAERKLRILINANYGYGDYHLVLDYIRRKGEPDRTPEQMRQDIDVFLRECRKEYRKAGLAPVTRLLAGDWQGATELIQNTDYVGQQCCIDIVTSNMSLFGATWNLTKEDSENQTERYKRFADIMGGFYDYCIIDNPPDIGLNVINALAITDEVIVPVKVDEDALEGLDIVTEQIEDAKAFNPALKLAGVLITSYQNTDGEAAGVEWLEQKTDFNILGIIRYSKKVAENTFMRKPIYEYSPCCGAAQGYKKFVTAYTGKAR